MRRRRKRIEKILQRPTRMRFSEVRAILEEFGMVCMRSKGSHFWFQKTGLGQIAVPKDGGKWVEHVYLDQVCALLKLDELDLDELD